MSNGGYPAFTVQADLGAECNELTVGQVHTDMFCISQDKDDGTDCELLTLSRRQLIEVHTAIGRLLHGERRGGKNGRLDRRPRSPLGDRIAARVAEGIKPSAVAAEFKKSPGAVYAACRVRGVDYTRWRSHKVQEEQPQ